MHHIAPFDNKNKPIVDRGDKTTPLVYFNIVKLQAGSEFSYRLPEYESCVVPATGTVDLSVDEHSFTGIGQRQAHVWDGEPEGVYAPTDSLVRIQARSNCEVFIAGARYQKRLQPFAVRPEDIDLVQYGSDDTKTHRKIKHILGQKQHGQVGRLLVSELYTVGCGGWSGFPPHKHDTDRLPEESKHDEVYNFRFLPQHGFGMQLLQRPGQSIGKAAHLIDGSSIVIDQGYHPCVAAPGYQMYYFTILGGASQRPLRQYFQPEHAYQVETIPGIKDMVAKFK